MAIWDDVVPESDKRTFTKAGMGGTMGVGERLAIVVVDMTYGFTDSRFPLGNSEMGQPTTQAIRRLLDSARPKGLPIFFTVPERGPQPAERGRWKSSWEAAKLEPGLPPANEIVEELEPLPGETIIKKRGPSGFFGTDLVSMLIFNSVDTLIVTGMTTSGCVRATVVDAFSYNFRVIVPQECSGDRAVVSHKVSLFDMHMKYADVTPLEAVLNYLGSLPPR
ncbi:MAG: isochorismatase family protein [Dehalococcoidia bacterium]|nr:isochorismatase family protein [Dehalococcoidia bacterium]